MRVGAILLMGGEGARFGSPLPKQFQHLAGKKLFLHTLETFSQLPWIDELLLVCHPDWVELVQKEVGSNTRVVSGGITRQESSYKGLNSFLQPPEFVMIHDAVRPFVSRRILEENLREVQRVQAVDTCIPSSDTLVHVPDGARVASIPPRAEWMRGQTPQSFAYDLIVEAHEKALKAGITNASDDCQLVLRLGKPLGVVLGEEENIKITTELDLFLAEQLLRLRTQSARAQNCSLEHKRFAILGGFGGIGSAVCHLLEKEGAISIPMSRKTGVDFTKPASIVKAFKQLGSIDGIINCAGSLLVKPLETHRIEEIEQLLQINFTGLVIACQYAQVKEGGHVINLASSAYTKGRKNYAIYSAAKAAVVNFTQALAEEKPELRVHVVIPQRTDSPMRRKNFPQEDPASLLDPLEVAKTIINLLKDPISTGSLIEVRKNPFASFSPLPYNCLHE
ncbi:MAG: 2-C-methyl-D-erythritol 4-phosphate cytidylyltransferase [Chlamydiales bacterium]|nr:2-C-methyl-D-erythritol 4-phosphate cytidylyltransferase [Chlamydiales bacterium]